VAGILAADHDATPFTGVLPHRARLNLTGIPYGGLVSFAAEFYRLMPPTGQFLLSTSIGFGAFDNSAAQRLFRVVQAVEWRISVAPHLGRFLHMTSAGNKGGSPDPANQSLWNSRWTIAARHDDLRPLLRGVNLPAADSSGFDALWGWILVNAPTAAMRSPNVLVVGSSNRAGVESAFSSLGSDLRAVGEDVYAPCVIQDSTYPANPARCNGSSARYSGTSMATPLVAGIATYLWSLEPSLTPVQLRTRLLEAYNQRSTAGVLDACYAVLRLDNGLGNPRMRRELLDVAAGPNTPGRDGRFDEHDLADFSAAFGAYVQQRAVAGTPNATDHSRYDLNGDGFTGDTTRRVPFDLNANGGFTTLTVTIEGDALTFNEMLQSDLRILCYYAYSGLYQGGQDARRAAVHQCALPPAPPPPPEPVPPGEYQLGHNQFILTGPRLPNGSGPCWLVDGIEVWLPLPLNFNRAVSCTTGGHSVHVTRTAQDFGRDRGSVAVSISGQVQGDAHDAALLAGLAGTVNHYLRVDGRPPGTWFEGVIRIVMRIKMTAAAVQLPTPCTPLSWTETEAWFNRGSANELRLWLFNSCGSPPLAPATIERVDTLEFGFVYDQPMALPLKLSTDFKANSPKVQSISAHATVEYEVLAILDLPLGATVVTYGGVNWPPPPVPSGGAGMGQAPAPPLALMRPEPARRPPETPP